MPSTELSAQDARRVALNAQGFGAKRPAKVTRGHLRDLARRLGIFQIDAVNVLVRAHYMPAFSRLGPYPTSWLDEMAYGEGRMFEAMAHALSLVDVELYPLLHWRRDGATRHKYWAAARARIDQERPGYIQRVLDELRDRGPQSWTTLSDPGRLEKTETKYAESSIMWWRWADGKSVLESLHVSGVLGVALRRNFEPCFDLIERVVPKEILEREVPAPDDAKRQLVAHAATALGVATVKDLGDYFRLSMADAKRAVNELVEEGTLVPVEVETWAAPAFLSTTARAKPVDASAVVSPFDPLVWERARTERLFGFRYRIEIYVPAPKREYGYYVLPFLLGDRLVGRVDLKAERKRRVLQVPAAHVESGIKAREVVGALAQELRQVAAWLDLDTIEIGDKGDLAGPLRKAVRAKAPAS